MTSQHAPSLRCQAHWQNAQSQHYNQILPKSLTALPTPSHGQKDNAAEKKDVISEDKNGQHVTGGIFYCRVSAEINGYGSLQTSSWLDSDVLRNRQQKHTAVRYI